MHLVIATPAGKVLDQECHAVVLPGAASQLEILPGHAALLTLLKPGNLRLKGPNEQPLGSFQIGGGFAEVGGNRVYVLAESAVSTAS